MPHLTQKRALYRALALLLPLCFITALAAFVAMSKRQADLNRQLGQSIRECKLDTALILLKQGANPDACDAYPQQVDLWSVVQRWFRRDEEKPTASSSGLYQLLDSDQRCECSTEQLKAVVTALIDRGADVNVTSEDGFTPLYLSLQGPSTEITRLLVERGANPNLACSGRTPLVQAAGWSEPEDVRLLLDAGADIDWQDAEGDTALMYAVGNGREENVEALLEWHPNVNLRNYQGETALQRALSAMKSRTLTPFHAMDDDEWKPIVAMLKKRGGKP